MGHISYEDAKKGVVKGLYLLAVITLIEVFFSLAGKGHIPGTGWMKDSMWVAYVIGLILIVLSLYKAYFIVYEFMHMAHEVPSLGMTVLLPMLLLVWGLIAFFYEGGAWGNNREVIKERDKIKTEKSIQIIGMEYDEEIKFFI